MHGNQSQSEYCNVEFNLQVKVVRFGTNILIFFIIVIVIFNGICTGTIKRLSRSESRTILPLNHDKKSHDDT